jgi:hypothetical protein
VPRQLKEIKNFNLGTILNLSEKDIPIDAAAYSLNVDPMSENGILNSINNDRIFLSTNNNLIDIATPISWNSPGNSEQGSFTPISPIIFNNIDLFENKTSARISFIGTKGIRENLIIDNIQPWYEQVLAFGTTALTWKPSAAISTTDDNFSYQPNADAIVNSDTTNLTVVGFSEGDATIQVNTNSPSALNNDTLRITTPDNRQITYIIKNSSGTTGTADGSGFIQIFCPTAATHNTDDEIAEEIKDGINDANGHGDRITITRSEDILTLVYAVGYLPTYLIPGTYFSLDTSNYASNEIMKVISVDVDNSKIYIKRGCFGTIIESYSAGSTYNVYANKMTIDGIQNSTYKTIGKIANWSNYSGNHLGGNSHYLYYCGDANTQESEGGKILTSTSNQSITFSASAKTVTFGSAISDIPFEEGETIIFYHSADSAVNNGFSAKILKKATSPCVLTLDTAPTDDTESSDSVYIEANLLKNNTLHHAVDTPTQTIDSGGEYKINDWTHIAYLENVSGWISNSYGYNTNTDDSKLTQDSDGGGYWETSPGNIDLAGTTDLAEKFYPFEANDRFIKIISEYITIGTSITIAIALIAGEDDTFIYMNADMGQYVAVNDILLVESEYMKVLKVEGKNITVTRGYFNSTIAAHNTGVALSKCANHAIKQSVAKEKLKAGQSYTISFYAQDDDRGAYGALSIKFNGGYIQGNGHWIETSRDLTLGYGDTINDVMQEHRWIPFQLLDKPNNDEAVNASYAPTGNGLDGIWRKYSLTFYCPKGVTFSTDMDIELACRGSSTTYIYLDLLDLSENNQIYATNNSSLFRTSSYIDNKGVKDLVSYDSKNRILKVIPNIFKDLYRPNEITSTFSKSSIVTRDITSSINNATIVANNREVHIGFGGEKEDSSPQWLGYVNHTVFGEDYSDELYLDEDTVHSYDEEGTSSISKMCLAGEHENLIAYWNNSGGNVTDDSVGANTLPDNTLRIHHADHRMNLGDNIIAREWMDTNNNWDGNGMWVVTDAGDSNYFDCKRYNTNDADPAEEGVFAISDIDGAGGTATATSDAHSLSTGDKVLIFGSHSDYNTTAGHSVSVTNTTVFTFTTSSTQVNQTGTGVKQFRMSYRPYFYYGIKQGEPYIYRIWPDTQIEATTDTVGSPSTTYTKGKIERSLPIDTGATSISTCYNKKSDGTGGGRVYILSSISDSIISYDVQRAYNTWTEATLIKHADISLEFKSFKWSNDHINGNIGGTAEVFGGLAEISTPSIEYAGVLSDILETKGPTSDESNLYDIDATTNTAISCAMFDTRLWVQCRPTGNSGFTESDRFLFCAKTEDANTDGPDVLYCADRTPPTTVVNEKIIRYSPHDQSANIQFAAGPGEDGEDSLETDKRAYFYSAWQSGFAPAISQISVYRKAGLISNFNNNESSFSNGVLNLTDGLFGRKTGYVNFGYNVGWIEPPSISIAKYGLFQIADNDGDGILDGTGVVVPTNISITDTTNLTGPYGKLHQRVCSHAVGLIGGTETKWQRHWGRLHGVHVASHGMFSSGHSDMPCEDAPEQMDANKVIFISTDMHYGDYQPDEKYTFDNKADESTNETKLQLNSSNGAAGLTVGDTIYIDGAGVDSATVITGIDLLDSEGSFSGTPDVITVAVPYVSFTSGSGNIFPHAIHKTYITQTGTNPNLGGVIDDEKMYHFSFDENVPEDGSVFNQGISGGHYTKTYFTPPSYWGGNKTYTHADRQKIRPGFVWPIDKLSFLGGVMMRPFEMDDDAFNDLIIGKGIHIDMPAWPNPVYHVANSSNLHYDVGNTSPNNSFASKLFITCPLPEDESQKSKIYACDLNFMYPDLGTQIAQDMVSGDGDTNDWNSDASDVSGNQGPCWDVCFAGEVATSGYVTSNGAAVLDGNNADMPIVILDVSDFEGNNTTLFGDTAGDSHYRDMVNALYGLCLSVMDATTGTIQTRYIVGSKDGGTDIKVKVHYPFGHPPAANDKFWVWKHSSVATAPIRLMKTETLKNSLLGLGDALIGDPTLAGPIYKDSGSLSIANSTAIVTAKDSAAATEYHNLTTDDIIRLSECSDDSYNGGVHEVTVTSPTTFTSSTIANSTGSAVTGDWEVLENSDSSVANPLTIPLVRPTLLTTFGGLDMRKIRGLTVDSINDSHETVDSVIKAELTTSANHLIGVGHTITLKNAASDTVYNGVYTVDKRCGGTTLDVAHYSAAGNVTDDYNLTTNQWEILLADTSGNSQIGELRAGFNQWDKGNIGSNIQRYDSTAEADRFMSFGESSVVVQATSLPNQSGDYFLKNTRYDYKISYIYDGYQEGPLSSTYWSFEDTSTRNKLQITIKVKDYSRRLSHVCLYRRNNQNDFFKLVKQISTKDGWNNSSDGYEYTIGDSGELGASYEARTGMSEILDTVKLNYGISTEIDGYLFAGDCAHSEIKNASNMIFRSRPGMFSMFDYVNDFLTLKSKPTALANFNGRLYAFDQKNIYTINQQSLAIESIYEGVGCINKDSVIVTEYGMFFADKNGAYLHSGQAPVKISETIHKGGSTEVAFGGTDNIRDVSWENTITNVVDAYPYVIYDPNTSSVLFNIEYLDIAPASTTNLTLSKRRQYVWSFSIQKKRWDLWELSADDEIGKPFLGNSGEVYYPIGDAIYEHRGGSSKRDYTWISKKLTMGEDSILKVFNKVKMNGLTQDINLGGDNIESSDRLLVTTSSGDVSSSDITSSVVATGFIDYKLSGSNKKGRWIQIKAENMTESLDSIGFIFRRKSTK